LAYGQTGSGKTFTLFGSKSKEEKGLVDYMIEDIISFANEKKIKVQCSFMQIYKEKVTDLMTSAPVMLR
jgi:kinesin family protein C2/C3